MILPVILVPAAAATGSVEREKTDVIVPRIVPKHAVVMRFVTQRKGAPIALKIAVYAKEIAAFPIVLQAVS